MLFFDEGRLGIPTSLALGILWPRFRTSLARDRMVPLSIKQDTAILNVSVWLIVRLRRASKTVVVLDSRAINLITGFPPGHCHRQIPVSNCNRRSRCVPIPGWVNVPVNIDRLLLSITGATVFEFLSGPWRPVAELWFEGSPTS